ncbi:MAG: hypothetical protein WC907_07220 [Acholeplasmataceae bacterium]
MKEYFIDNQMFYLQFNRIACDSESNILNSRPFLLILKRYIKQVKNEGNPEFRWIVSLKAEDLLSLYKALFVWDLKEVAKSIDLLNNDENRISLYRFSENLYTYWIKLERYGFFNRGRLDDDSSTNQRLINSFDMFSNLVLKLYRTITQKLINRTYNLLRQLPAGTQANISIVSNSWTYDSPYTKLPEQGFISSLLLRPPLMTYSKMNTRSGMFQPISENPLEKININKNNYVVLPLKVGPYLTYVYMHHRFLKYAVSLGSLFESAEFSEFKDKKPDLIYIFGIDEDEYDGTYHYDKNSDIYIGFVSKNLKNDYFGYVKKMILTLYNTKLMYEHKLPIHGAMFKVSLKNGITKNICIMGDSGAGKSETIESLRLVASDKVTNIETIYDDMGYFYLNNKTVVSSGSEIGAFVRLDDLEQGYAYKQIDRAVFLNPHRTNARVILPASTYDFIMQKHQVDLLLYANNYDEENHGLKIFDNIDEITHIFEDGARKAKGTTSEVGMTRTYFANPFGPHQEQNIAKPLVKEYFEKLFKTNIPVGVIYTKLAIDGYEQKGPQEAALNLIDFISKK